MDEIGGVRMLPSLGDTVGFVANKTKAAEGNGDSWAYLLAPGSPDHVEWVEFTDGSVLLMATKNGYALSEVTWEDGWVGWYAAPPGVVVESKRIVEDGRRKREAEQTAARGDPDVERLMGGDDAWRVEAQMRGIWRRERGEMHYHPIEEP